jgi:NAD(P)-dependent dehydrogenase (short-subunit alcohol dehydrogenase family)
LTAIRPLATRVAVEKQWIINNVSVGCTETDALLVPLKALPVEVLEKIKAQQAVGHRMAAPDDIAMIVGFLASEESKRINGANVCPSKWGKFGCAPVEMGHWRITVDYITTVFRSFDSLRFFFASTRHSTL